MNRVLKAGLCLAVSVICPALAAGCGMLLDEEQPGVVRRRTDVGDPVLDLNNRLSLLEQRQDKIEQNVLLWAAGGGFAGQVGSWGIGAVGRSGKRVTARRTPPEGTVDPGNVT